MDNDSVGEKTFKKVKVKNIRRSSVIPVRYHDVKLSESTKTVGVQQPLTVRPVASSSTDFELIDGQGRHQALEPENEVWVEVREATDAEVFKINAATSIRTQKTAYENALFYAAYVETVTKEKGGKKAISIVVKETQISESELSQYLKINELFLALNKLEPLIKFEKIEAMGINKLYDLSRLLDKPELAEAARQVENEADNLTEEGVSSIVDKILKKYEDRGFCVDADQEMGNTASNDVNREAVLAARLKDVSGKVVQTREEMNAVLQKVDIDKLPTTELAIGMLEKMLVSFRRLTYYCNKLQEANGETAPKTS